MRCRADEQHGSSRVGWRVYRLSEAPKRPYDQSSMSGPGFPRTSLQVYTCHLLALRKKTFRKMLSLSFDVKRDDWPEFWFRVTLEPTSSSAPRFASRSSVNLIEDFRSSFSLFCPAQSYPAPVFRSADNVSNIQAANSDCFHLESKMKVNGFVDIIKSLRAVPRRVLLAGLLSTLCVKIWRPVSHSSAQLKPIQLPSSG